MKKVRLTSEQQGMIYKFLSKERTAAVCKVQILRCLHMGYSTENISILLNVEPRIVLATEDEYFQNGLDSILSS